METQKSNPLELEAKIVEVLKTVYDPEIPVSVYDLGLIYDIDISEDKVVLVKMTLTAPNCPVADSLPIEVRDKIKALDGVKDADVKIVFDPPWDYSMLSEEAKLTLGFM